MNTNKRGFTVLELAIAMVIFGVVMYAAGNLFQQVAKETTKAQRAIEKDMGGLIAERIVRADLMDSGASLNNIVLADNNSKPFFDFRPDWPCSADCERTLSISNRPADKKEFALLAYFDDLMPPQMYPPPAAYQALPNNNMSTAGTLTYKGINYLGNLVKIVKPATYPSFWASDATPRLLMFYSPVPGRPVVANAVNMAVMPRNTMYLGRLTYGMSGTNPTGVNIAATNMSGVVNTDHPLRPGVNMLDTSQLGTNVGFDRFLRTLPPVGGVGAVALFRPVRMVKYVMKRGTGPRTASEIWRFPWDVATNAWSTNGSLLASDVYGLVLRRRAISSPIIDYVVARDEASYKRALLP